MGWWWCSGCWWRSMPWPSRSEQGEDGSPVDEFPLHIPSGGEVSATSGLSICRLPDPLARDGTIWGGGLDGNYTTATIRRQLYWQTKLVPPYSWSLPSLEVPTAMGFLLELLVNSKLTIFLFLAPFHSDTTGPSTMSIVSIICRDPGENKHKRCVQHHKIPKFYHYTCKIIT